MPASPSASPPAVHQLKISSLPDMAAPAQLGITDQMSNRLNTVSHRMRRAILPLLRRWSKRRIPSQILSPSIREGKLPSSEAAAYTHFRWKPTNGIRRFRPDISPQSRRTFEQGDQRWLTAPVEAAD